MSVSKLLTSSVYTHKHITHTPLHTTVTMHHICLRLLHTTGVHAGSDVPRTVPGKLPHHGEGGPSEGTEEQPEGGQAEEKLKLHFSCHGNILVTTETVRKESERLFLSPPCTVGVSWLCKVMDNMVIYTQVKRFYCGRCECLHVSLLLETHT